MKLDLHSSGFPFYGTDCGNEALTFCDSHLRLAVHTSEVSLRRVSVVSSLAAKPKSSKTKDSKSVLQYRPPS